MRIVESNFLRSTQLLCDGKEFDGGFNIVLVFGIVFLGDNVVVGVVFLGNDVVVGVVFLGDDVVVGVIAE